MRYLLILFALALTTSIGVAQSNELWFAFPIVSIESKGTNKYLVASVFFIVWMLFFDQRDYFQQRERKAELNKLEAKKRYYVEEIEKTRKQLQDLQNNPAALEKFARERYLMKRNGEDIFIIEDSADLKK